MPDATPAPPAPAPPATPPATPSQPVPVVPVPPTPPVAVAPAPAADAGGTRYTFPMRAEDTCHPSETPCGMYVVDLAAGTVITVSVVPSDVWEEDPPRTWVARGATGEVPAQVDNVADADPPGLLTRVNSYDVPFTLALKDPGHALLPAPKPLPGIGYLSQRIVVLGERFYGAANVRGKPWSLAEIDPKAGTTRVLKTPGAKINDVYPAGDKLVLLYERARKSTIGVYDVAAERFTTEVTLPDAERRQCKKNGSINELGIFWLSVAPDASRVRATFLCYRDT
jgi:hypothetical protein